MSKAIVHLHGLVRRVEVKRKNADGTVYGTGISVLSEPDGDTMEVTAFIRDLPEADALDLKGKHAHLVIAVGATAGSRGGAFLDTTLVSVVATK